MINNISCTVMNLLLTVLLNKTRFTPSKTRFFGFLVDFWTRNLVYFEATNSGILLQHRNISETIFCTVVNLLLIVLLNKLATNHGVVFTVAVVSDGASLIDIFNFPY